MHSTSGKKGFTLIELIVVIGIVLVVSTIIFSLGNPGIGQSLGSSQRIVSGMVQGARGQAVMKSSKVRLIIHNDPAEMDKFRRFVGMIVNAGGQGSNTKDDWVALNQGAYLPKGIYYDAASSESESSSLWSDENTMNLEFPKLTGQDGSSGTEYYYYEFEPNGTVAHKNAWLVLRAATMIPDGAAKVKKLKVDSDREFVRSALILRRSGSVTFVENPQSLEDSGGSIEMPTIDEDEDDDEEDIS